MTAISKLDFLGNVLLAVASILLVFALQEAGSFVWSWSSPIIFCLSQQCNEQIQPIFPMRLAKSRLYILCLLITLLGGFIYIALVIKIPERLQIIHGDSALWAGVHLLPMLGSCAFGSFLGGTISKQANLTSQTLVVGSLLQVIGLTLVFGFSSGLGLGILLGFITIYGIGVGLSFATCTMIAAVEAQNDDLAAAQGTMAQARSFGGALGLAVCTIVLNVKLQNSPGPESESSLGQQELDQIRRNLITVLSLSDESRQEVIRIYLGAFRDQSLGMLIVAVFALLVSLGTYKSKPSHVVDVMVQHKELAGRPSIRGDAELSSVSSVRSLVR
ncbi:3eb6f827-e20a-420d-bbb4-b1f5f0abbf23 [Thermothielavioides terrestris]|uniref:3eb6f827-e20a-420d-bbb4-b1f5f0abbf23 n=1 Tax=Thermothielavioides terrestris TaxID=2587410 RepID=A0A3S4EUS2_9PEZI|nr:3eb6f827-e20a-420d-bbb4-b1f5f0abbf23 [Thermothielavioides terrestris]